MLSRPELHSGLCRIRRVTFIAGRQIPEHPRGVSLRRAFPRGLGGGDLEDDIAHAEYVVNEFGLYSYLKLSAN